MTFDEIAAELHETAKSKGFYDELDMSNFNSQAKQLAMIHSEVTEVLEALRKSQGERAVVEELVDIAIRLFDLYEALRSAGVVSLSFDEVFADKTAINKTRDRMHGVLG